MKIVSVRLIAVLIILLNGCAISYSQNWSEVIEGKTFDKGLSLSGKENVLIKNCQITNPNGSIGLELSKCKNVRIENCVIRNVGNETMSDYVSGSLFPKDSADYPQKRGKFHSSGILLNNSSNITISKCEITDIFGRGLLVEGDVWENAQNIVIDSCRIAYIYDDGMLFTVSYKGGESEMTTKLTFKGGRITNNLIHDIGLGTSQLPFARHGMYLKARDVLVEGNTIYNCFYGQGISLRNAGIIRNNKVWNCYAGLCIAYWAQTNVEGSSKTVVIEGNQCRQDYKIDFRMRHISFLNKNHNAELPMISVAYNQGTLNDYIEKFIIRNNTCIANQDYLTNTPLIGGIGALKPYQSVKVENNNFYDNRNVKKYYDNIPFDTKTAMQLVANWQLKNFETSLLQESKWPNDRKIWAWTNGVLYTGMFEMAKATNDSIYWNFLKNIGERQNWKLGPNVYHADDMCVGQLYAGLAQRFNKPSMITPTIERLKFIMANPKTTSLDFTVPHNQERWSWCDALFMAPTVFAKVGKITGDKSYFKFLDKEFWTTYDTLYNKKDSLFFRDTRYKSMKEANGENVYWARGNGWVIGGLCTVIDNLPKNHPTKRKYIQLYKEMMIRIANLQDEKGFWHPSLLDAASFPMPETSASSFFTYGLAWGINRGYIDRKTYEPITQKAWSALVSAIHPDGKLGWVQEIGADPKGVSFDDTEVYGVGAFLLAGSEMLKLK